MIVKELAKAWHEAGVEKGDTLLLHSNLKRTLKQYLRKKKKITPNIILESFLEALGEQGTLVIPLFNFDFTTGVPFDFRHTPSHMGVLTEEARNHPLAVRTGHPIYSFVAIGSEAEKFRDIDNFSGYGSDSPFAMVRELNGKIAVLNLPDQNSMTFYHYVEEMNNVSYRYHKSFEGEYIDSKGKAGIKTYGLFVRNIEKGVVTRVDPMGDLLWEKDLYTGDRYNQGNGLRVVSARKLYDFVSDVIQSGCSKGLLYGIDGEANE
jgi:aminoglycoside 3-N-acetyltransferase